MPRIYGPEVKGWRARLDYTSTQDLEKNSSEITATLYVYNATGGSFNNDPKGPSYTIQGHKEYKPYSFPSGGVWHKIGSRNFTAAHNSDGTKSLTLSASWDSANETQYTPARLTVSDTVALPRIPRASSVSASGLTIGKPGEIKINRASSKFTHELSYRAGGKLHKITTGKVSTSAAWTPPRSLLPEIPSSTTGKITIVCTTYSGAVKIGTQEDKASVKVPTDIVPEIQSVTITPVTENQWIAEQGIYVRHYSKARVVTKATAGEGSSIASIKIDTGTTVGTGADWTSGLLTPGERTFTVTVTDKRGRKASKPEKIFVYDYTDPLITGSSAKRCTELGKPSSGGDHVLAEISAAYTDLGGRNKLTMQIRGQQVGGSFGSATPMESGVPKILPDYDPTLTYTVKFEIRDLVGNVQVQTYTVPTDTVALHLRPGGKGAAFGKYAETDGLEVAWPARFLKDAAIGGKSLLGLLAAVTQETPLPVKAQMAPGWKLSPDGISAKLVGNILRLSIAVESTSTIQPGDFQNKDICTVSITHGGRITSHSNAGNNTSFTGGLAAFYTSGSRVDSTTLSFDFKMSSLAIAGNSWSCYMLFQVSIDPDAFLQ